MFLHGAFFLSYSFFSGISRGPQIPCDFSSGFFIIISDAVGLLYPRRKIYTSIRLGKCEKVPQALFRIGDVRSLSGTLAPNIPES